MEASGYSRFEAPSEGRFVDRPGGRMLSRVFGSDLHLVSRGVTQRFKLS